MMMFGLCRACRDGLSLLLLSRSNALGGEEGRPENPVGMHKNKINKLRALLCTLLLLLVRSFLIYVCGCSLFVFVGIGWGREGGREVYLPL